MSNDSSTGGPLAPLPSPAPLEGKALLQFFQALFVGITGLPGDMFRPRWQAEPPNIPASGTAWAAFGITSRTSDTFPYVGHDGSADGCLGADTLQRHETLEILTSFYDTGVTGEADLYASLLRDGLSIAQNREPLQRANMGLVETGSLITVPSLLKQRWLCRVDLKVTIRRQILRTYPVLNLLSISGTIETETTTIAFNA